MNLSNKKLSKKLDLPDVTSPTLLLKYLRWYTKGQQLETVLETLGERKSCLQHWKTSALLCPWRWAERHTLGLCVLWILNWSSRANSNKAKGIDSPHLPAQNKELSWTKTPKKHSAIDFSIWPLLWAGQSFPTDPLLAPPTTVFFLYLPRGKTSATVQAGSNLFQYKMIF